VIFALVEAQRIDPAVAGKETQGPELSWGSIPANLKCHPCASNEKILTAEFAEKGRGDREEYPFYV
jgi:hypothetical protein